MLDGRPLVDAHLQAARLPTLKPAWTRWAHDLGGAAVLERVYAADGTATPDGSTTTSRRRGSTSRSSSPTTAPR